MRNQPIEAHRATGGKARTAATAIAGFLLLVVFEAVLGQFVQTAVLRWLPQLLAAIVLLVSLWLYWHGGRFHRSELPQAPRWERVIARGGSALLAIAYVVMTILVQEDGFWPAFVTAACLVGAAVLALREVLSPRPTVGSTVMALTGILVGVAALQSAPVDLLYGSTLGIMLSTLTLAIFLFAVALLRGRLTLGGGALLIAGGTLLVFGITTLHAGSVKGGINTLLIGVALMGLGVAAPRKNRALNRTLAGAASLLFGGVFLLSGVMGIDGDLTPADAAILLFGTAPLLIAVAFMHRRSTAQNESVLAGIATLLLGAASLLFALGGMHSDPPLFSVTFSLFGGAALALGIGALWPTRPLRRWRIRLQQYLTERPNNPPSRHF